MTRPLAELLVDHLRTTGTGEAKLKIVAAVASQAGSLQEFMNEIRSAVPSGTLQKIERFVASLPVAAPEAIAETQAMEPPPEPAKAKSGRHDRAAS